jgi:transposase
MKSIVRRDTQEDYQAFLQRLAKSEGLELDAAGLRRMDRRRKKRMSNQEWVNPSDPEAEITRMKDGTTRLAYKAEQAVDMETGAIVAVTTHSGATGDTTSIEETLPAAGEAVAEQIATATPEGKFEVNAFGVEELVTDSGYHSDGVLMKVAGWGVRTYIAEPDRAPRNWDGKEAERKAANANQRRVTGRRGKILMRQRGEKLERPFAHQYETGGMRRLYVRGRENVHKKVLLQAAACNLALLLRRLFGAGTPRGLHSRGGRLLFALICLMQAKLNTEAMQIGELSPE